MKPSHELDRKLLAALFECDTRSQADLAAHLGETPNATTKAVSRLVAAGNVELVRDPNDGRQMIPRLSIAVAFDRLKATFERFLGATT